MMKLNKVFSQGPAFMAIGYEPMLAMYHVAIIEKDFFYNELASELPEYKLLANMIEADTIDIVDFTEDLCLIVDDEGLLKSGNLVYEIQLGGTTHQIAGRFAFGRNEFCEHKGLMTVPLAPTDFIDLAQLEIKMIGRVK